MSKKKPPEANETTLAEADALTRFDSRQLRHLLAVVNSQGFTKAAEKLNMTQPALTRSIQVLEGRLNVRLIERSPKSFRLTKFGEIVVGRARQIEIEFNQTLMEIDTLKDGFSGSVSVGVGPSSISYIAPAIKFFQQQRPNVTVEVIVASMEANLEALHSGKLDIICSALQFPGHRDLKYEKLADVKNIILADSSHPLVKKKSIFPADLLKFPWVVFTNDRMGHQQNGAYFAANELPPPQPAIETNTIEMVFSFLKEGPYIASVPSLVLEAAHLRGLEEIKIIGSFWNIQYGLTYSKNSNLAPVVSSLINTLRTHIKKVT